jgi:hypothetical protein
MKKFISIVLDFSACEFFLSFFATDLPRILNCFPYFLFLFWRSVSLAIQHRISNIYLLYTKNNFTSLLTSKAVSCVYEEHLFRYLYFNIVIRSNVGL